MIKDTFSYDIHIHCSTKRLLELTLYQIISGGGTPSAGQSITIGRWAMTVKFRSETSSSLILGGTVSQSTKIISKSANIHFHIGLF